MQGEFSNPPSRFRPRHVLWGLLLLALLGVLSREWVHRRNEPRYLGRTEREWFPLWPEGSLPAAELTVAPAEALPMLIAARHRPDSRFVDTWNSIAVWLRRFRRADLHAVEPSQVRYDALQAMVQSTCQPGFAGALMDRFSGLSPDDQFAFLVELGRFEGPAKGVRELSPLLLRCLAEGRRDLALYAGVALMKERALARRHLAQLLPIVAGELTGNTAGSPGLPLFLNRLGDLGTVDSAEVQPLVLAVRADASRTGMATHNTALGLITLSRLAPEEFPPHGYLNGDMNWDERNERVTALGELLVNKLGRTNLPEDLEAWLELFLRFDGYDDQPLSSRWRIAYRDRVLWLLQELPRRSPLAPQIQSAMLAGMDHSFPVVRRATAAALVQIKKPAPKVVERSATLLLEGFEPDFMLRVLGNARVIPDPVHGLVRDLAAGAVPVNWTPKPTLSDESARRIGLPLIRDSLPALAKELLRKVEETGGPGVRN